MTRFTAVIASAVLSIGLASAQGYPAKPVRIVVPYPAGGASDTLARLLGAKLNEVLGQSVIVDNRAGANGNLGADYVAKSAPDGHTLLLAGLDALSISPSLYKLPFDPIRDFAPVTMVAYSPHLLVVHPSLPVKTVKELIALTKSRPGELNFAVPGIGSAPHLAGVVFETQAGIKWTYVPYKGLADATTGLLAGQVHVTFGAMLATYPHVSSGKLKLLAVSSAKRIGAIPTTPTVAEAGLPGFETGTWQGLLAPAGTPREIIGRLSGDASRILNTAEMKKNLSNGGAEVYTMTPQQLEIWFRSEVDKWAKVVRAANLTASP